MNNKLKSFSALFTAIAFFLLSCSTTQEIGRRTIRVEREPVSKGLDHLTPELSINQDDQLIKIKILRKGTAEIKETNVEEIHLEKRTLKVIHQVASAFALIIGTPTVILLVFYIVDTYPKLKANQFAWNIKDYYETGRGEERIIKEETTIPVKDAPLTIRINEFQQVLKSDREGEAEINLLPVLNNFLAIPSQLLITCSAQFKDKSLTKELTIPESEIIKIVQSETGRPQLAPNLAATVNFEKSEGTIHTGNTDKLVVTITNQGKGEAYQLKGAIICPDPILDRREVIFGRLDPGKTKKAFIHFEIPKEYPGKTLPIEVHFSEYNKYNPEPVETSLRIIP